MVNDEMEYDEMIAVINAAKENKKIEYRLKCEGENDWKPVVTDKPFFNFHERLYRVAPEPLFVPFDTIEELFEGEYDKALFLKSKTSSFCYLVTAFIEEGNEIYLNGSTIAHGLKDIFDCYTYMNNQLCGKPKV